MALNPFFLQGSASEQRLVQELINEQLKIYGVEVTYIPRKIVNRNTIIEEVTTSKFDDNYLLEAYVENFDGYSGQGDLMTKFGVNIKDELTLTVSKQRFEDFIVPFLEGESDAEIILASRPREGDLVYFPLGQRLFEVKFVEHEQPFYQLGKNYIYQLQCELYEYEGDEIIDTSIAAIDTLIEDKGPITDLQLISTADQARATTTIGTGGIQRIFLNNDGYGFTSIPTISFTAAPGSGTDATAVGILTTRNNITSIKEILITNAGSGYTQEPVITITGGGGAGAAATCSLVPSGKKGIQTIVMTNFGLGYLTAPSATVTLPSLTPNHPASVTPVIRTTSGISTVPYIGINSAGAGFFSPPVLTVGTGSTTGIGTFWFNEEVIGATSNVVARVKNWDQDTSILQVGIQTGQFYPGEQVTGQKSGAVYNIQVSAANTTTDKYKENENFELEADQILDFAESNPFGTY